VDLLASSISAPHDQHVSNVENIVALHFLHSIHTLMSLAPGRERPSFLSNMHTWTNGAVYIKWAVGIRDDYGTSMTTPLSSSVAPQRQSFAPMGEIALHRLHFAIVRQDSETMAIGIVPQPFNCRRRLSNKIKAAGAVLNNYLNPPAHCIPMDIKCPKCGKAMVPGYLGAESLLQGANWYVKKTVMALDGEKLKDPDLSGMVYMDSLRCSECRIILSKY
jgi:hypothetical protein